MLKATDNPEFPFIDLPSAGECFADGCSGVTCLNGVVRIVLESWRADHGKGDSEPHAPLLKRVVVGRVNVPILGAEGLARDILKAVAVAKSSDNPLIAGRA